MRRGWFGFLWIEVEEGVMLTITNLTLELGFAFFCFSALSEAVEATLRLLHKLLSLRHFQLPEIFTLEEKVVFPTMETGRR